MNMRETRYEDLKRIDQCIIDALKDDPWASRLIKQAPHSSVRGKGKSKVVVTGR